MVRRPYKKMEKDILLLITNDNGYIANVKIEKGIKTTSTFIFIFFNKKKSPKRRKKGVSGKKEENCNCSIQD